MWRNKWIMIKKITSTTWCGARSQKLASVRCAHKISTRSELKNRCAYKNSVALTKSQSALTKLPHNYLFTSTSCWILQRAPTKIRLRLQNRGALTKIRMRLQNHHALTKTPSCWIVLQNAIISTAMTKERLWGLVAYLAAFPLLLRTSSFWGWVGYMEKWCYPPMEGSWRFIIWSSDEQLKISKSGFVRTTIRFYVQYLLLLA